MQRALELLRSARFREPVPHARATAQILARYGVDFGKARARAGFARGHLLDIVVYLPGGSGASHENDAAEALVLQLIGEESFDRWVGSVIAIPGARVGPLPILDRNSEERSALGLETLPETIRAAIAGLKRGLPDLLALEHDAADAADDWVAFELVPALAADYAAQDDLVFCSTRTPELKKSFLRGEPFFSGRFTNSGALFAYLKYESFGSAEARLAERAELEDLVRRSLTAEQGLLVGLGLGLHYSYLDLALIDAEGVHGRLFPALRTAKISKRAWLLFCDSALDREFVAVHVDAPAPYWG